MSQRVLATWGVAGALAAAVVAGAGTAQAVEVPQWGNVRYVFCSNTQDNNDIVYYDALGKREQIATLADQTGDVWCSNVDVMMTEESFVWSAISHDDASYVYTAIYVNGRMMAREENRSDYGFVFAQAM
ncbi:hypothetical protein ACFWU5_07770 [Nocardia sp. NPDC058640]|uniref:hypothetical protein n=1 Tax=Nocardia sp. NPDC058640 TaxID=3346571 RepID=UPI00365B47A6